jgi:cell wall-associated NlpC family hydrolase
MRYAICNLSIVPVRAKPADDSEMTTQLLFGELMEIQGVHKGWTKIKMTFDDYEGWVDMKQICNLSEETFRKFNDFPPHLTLDVVSILKNITEDYMFPVLLGSSLPYIVNNTFYIEELKYQYESEVTDSNKKGNVEDLIKHAFMYLYTPYLWGGRSPFGIDCSGFVQMAFRFCGIKFPRDAWQQAELGVGVGFIDQAKVGDIAFFENDDGKIIHTGILLGKDKIIHASGFVRIDKIDHEGIFNESLKKYTHKLRIIKRIPV